jgi:hypothetical protein
MIIDIHEDVYKRNEVWEKVCVYLIANIGDENIVGQIEPVLSKSRTSLCIFLSGMYFYRKIKNRYSNYVFRLDNMIKCDVTKYLVKKKKNAVEMVISNDYMLFIISIIISYKGLLDIVYTNFCWSRISGISVKDLNLGERCALEILDYNITMNLQFLKDTVKGFEDLFENVRLNSKGKRKRKNSRARCILPCLASQFSCFNF